MTIVDAGAVIPPGSCAAPTPLPLDQGVFSVTPAAGADLFAPSGNCRNWAGPDAVYSLEVPAATRVTISMTAGVSFLAVSTATCQPGLDGGLQPLACVDGRISSGVGVLQVPYVNSSSAPVQLYVVAGVYGSGGTLRFDVASAPLLQGDRCTNAEPLDAGVTLSNRSFVGFASDVACLTAATGADRYFVVDVPAGQRLDVLAVPGAQTDLVLSVGDPTACTCGTTVNGGTAGAWEAAGYANTGAVTARRLIIVDSIGAAGTFELRTSLSPTPPPALDAGAGCSQAIPLPDGTFTVTATTSSFAFPAGAGCSATGRAADSTFSLTVPPHSRATVTATASLDVVLNFLEDAGACGALDAGLTVGAVCSQTANGAFAGGTEVLTVANPTSQPREGVVVVDFTSLTSTAVTLTKSTAAIGPGETCAAPVVLTQSQLTLTGQTLAGYVHDFAAPDAGGCRSFAGADRYYALSVPSGSRLQATVRPTSAWNPTLDFSADRSLTCDAPVACLASANSAAVGGAEVLTYLNATGAAVDGLLVVGATSAPLAPTQPEFLLDVRVGSAAVPVGDLCAEPEELSGAVSGLPGTTTGFVNAASTVAGACTGYEMPGSDHLYAVTVPAGATLTATVRTPSVDGGGVWDSAVYLLAPEDCGLAVASCLSAPDTGDSAPPGAPETVTFTNAGAAPRRVLIVVDTYAVLTTGSYFLDVSLTP